MSYADVAASGPKQTPEEAAAPQLPEVTTNVSASTASLVDVDLPSVHTVNSDFLEQEIQTETQAHRIAREAEERAVVRVREAREKATRKAQSTDSWLADYFDDLSDNAATAVVAANLAGVVSLSGFLGYKAWGLYERGRLSWQAVGLGVGVLAGVAAIEGLIGRYLYKAKKGGSS